MDGINAQLHRNGGKQRGEDVQGGGGVQEAAGDQQHHVDDDEEDNRVAVGNGEHEVLNGQIQSCTGQDIAEQGGAHGDEHNRGGGGTGVDEDVLHLLPVDLAIDEHAHDQAIEHGDSGGLGGGEDAAIDTAQDDHGHQQAPEGILEGLQPFLAGGLGLHRQVGLAAHEQGGHDQAQAHQQAGDDAGLEQVGDGGVSDGAVHHEGDGRGNDHADGAAGGHQSAGKGRGIARLLQSGDHNQAQGRHGGRTGAGDGREEAGHHHADHGHAAADVAQALFRQVDEAAGDTGLLHHVAGEDEERDRQQDELAAGRGAQTGKHAHDGVQGFACALHQDSAYAGHAQADGDGCAEGQQQHKDTQ